MADPKLTAQMLDLSRNIEKLTGSVKTNTESIEKLEKTNIESESGLRDSVSKLDGGLKNLDFESLSAELKGVNKNIKDLDFKKLGEDFKNITKSFSGIKDLTKNFEKASKGLDVSGKIKEVVSGGAGKKILGSFSEGGTVPQTGSYLVGEKGPEIVKLEEGSDVVPNDKLISADQQLTEKRGPSEKQIEKYKKSLLNEDPDYYSEFPEQLDYDIKYWINQNRYQKEAAIDSLLEGKGVETFTREDVDKLTSPVSQTASIPTAEEKLSKSEKRGKERDERKEAKQKSKTEKKEEELETKKEEKLNIGQNKEFSKPDLSGIKKSAGALIEKTAGLGKGLISKNIENPLLKKASEAGLKSVSGVLNKPGEKPKSGLVTSPTEPNKLQEKPKAVSKVTPLKSPASKPAESPDKKAEKIEGEKKTEQLKTGSSTPSIGSSQEAKAESKTEPPREKSPSKGETNMSKADIDDMKSALFRIASLLEGTLIVSPIESPYRPNSKRI